MGQGSRLFRLADRTGSRIAVSGTPSKGEHSIAPRCKPRSNCQEPGWKVALQSLQNLEHRVITKRVDSNAAQHADGPFRVSSRWITPLSMVLPVVRCSIHDLSERERAPFRVQFEPPLLAFASADGI